MNPEIIALLSLLTTTCSALLVLIIFWYLDVFEREPIGKIIATFTLGIVFYYISIFLFNFISSSSPFFDTRPLGTWVSSIIFLIGTQIAGAFAVSALFRKQFDSLTDYILYFSSFGIGFSFGEDTLRYFISGSSAIFNQGLADKLFNTVYGSTAVSAFSLGVVGAIFFLFLNRKALQLKSAFLSSIINFVFH